MDIMLVTRTPRVVVLVMDVGYSVVYFPFPDGLQVSTVSNRVLDTPIAEGGIVAAAIGNAFTGSSRWRNPVRRLTSNPAFDAGGERASRRLRYRRPASFSRR